MKKMDATKMASGKVVLRTTLHTAMITILSRLDAVTTIFAPRVEQLAGSRVDVSAIPRGDSRTSRRQANSS